MNWRDLPALENRAASGSARYTKAAAVGIGAAAAAVAGFLMRFQAAVQLVHRQTAASACCAACAAPIDFGAVWRGRMRFAASSACWGVIDLPR